MSFRPPRRRVATVLKRVRFQLCKKGSPVGVLVTQLYAHTGVFGSGKPTGDALVESDSITMESLPSYVNIGSFAWFDFVFSTPYILKPDVVLCAEAIAESATTLDASNYPRILGNGIRGQFPGYSVLGICNTFINSAWSALSDIFVYQILGEPKGLFRTVISETLFA